MFSLVPAGAVGLRVRPTRSLELRPMGLLSIRARSEVDVSDSLSRVVLGLGSVLWSAACSQGNNADDPRWACQIDTRAGPAGFCGGREEWGWLGLRSGLGTVLKDEVRNGRQGARESVLRIVNECQCNASTSYLVASVRGGTS